MITTATCPKSLPPYLLARMDAYWRAANYPSVGQIYLCDNPLLKRQLTDKLVEHRHYVNKHGQDMPEIREWTWNSRQP